MLRPIAADAPAVAPERVARRIVVTGRVQGVGYRPFVYRAAQQLGLDGWVLNGSGEVCIHAEGPVDRVKRFEAALTADAPPLARPRLACSEAAVPAGAVGFFIRKSEAAAEADIHLPPDLYTCQDCIEEMQDSSGRRYRYPFINCTQCGPRYTLIEALPYDRPNTSMRGFALCPECKNEFESPSDRRFHAQPLACPECGPRLQFSASMVTIDGTGKAITATLEALRSSKIVAVKGVGGYHLLCDAASDTAVNRLRGRKHRPHKPLAVMFPIAGADGLDRVRAAVCLDQTEAASIVSAIRPIVLVRKRQDRGLSAALSPGLSELGVFLPYSPLHHILLSELDRPLVATSANLSGEPVITDNTEAERRLGQIADAFLHHNRPIVRPADDPVVRIIDAFPRPLRLGRGIAPLEMDLPGKVQRPCLAVGGHMKNTVALAWNRRLVVSPHIGDLDSPRSQTVFEQVVEDLQQLYGVRAECLVSDLHPGYASTRWAVSQGLPLQPVQHHRAHASTIVADNPDVDRWLVFTWDGVGYGDDGTLWGGEAFAGSAGAWRRVASFRPFRLVGGDKAGREPWRSAAALMWQAGLRWKPAINGATLLAQAWQQGANCRETSAVGRLFDAAASLVLGRHKCSFEGQGPMELESLAQTGCQPIVLPTRVDDGGLLRSDWQPLLPMLSDDRVSESERASTFHQSMAQALVDQALALRAQYRFDAIGLTGGVFQNRLLCEHVIAKLTELGFDTRLPESVPANDAGLCVGQIIEAMLLDRQLEHQHD